MKITILGNPKWEVRLLDPVNYESEFGNDSAAMTVVDNKTRYLVFRTDCFSLGTIRHELLHAFIRQAPIRSADLNAEQIEEVCCEIVDDHWNAISHLSRHIYRKLKPRGRR